MQRKPIGIARGAFLLTAFIITFTSLARTGHAGDLKMERDKIVALNQEALLSYQANDFEAARNILTKALREARQAGLEHDKMTARTYLHLGAVFWVGFQDRKAAIANFILAKQIRPDIELTPSIATADLKSVFDLAATDPAKTEEPDLPLTMTAQLMCALPEVVPPNQEVPIRCALMPGLNAEVVQLHYRTPDVEEYQVLAMRRTAKGWYVATLPASVMKEGELLVYFDALDSSDSEIAGLRDADAPSVIAIHKHTDVETIPLPPRPEPSEEDYQGRGPGAYWFSLGAGVGWGFVPAGNLEWEKNIWVSRMAMNTGMFHLLPEVGYQISYAFGLALQARWEFIHQEQLLYRDPDTGTLGPASAYRTGSPSTMAFAVFGRAIRYTNLSDSGALQVSYSGDLGGGYVRFPVRPSAKFKYNSDTQRNELDPFSSIAETDARRMGPVLLGGSGGLIYHVSKHLAATAEVRLLAGLPDFGVVIEGALSAQLAFGGTAKPTPTSED